jgi:ribulose-5-phosphate 4-epimerase/fuculose-1-phosphate aldolase
VSLLVTDPEEGVIKFQAEHRHERLDPVRYVGLVRELSAWRRIFLLLGLVGQDDARYSGAGFGNLSARVEAGASRAGRRAMLITGTQTGALPELELTHFCLVDSYDAACNRVVSRGEVMPSSEAMTHGAIYDLSEQIRFVFHAHAPAIWERAHKLGIPTTAADVPYGTPAMAFEVMRLYSESDLATLRVLAMAGHLDGIIAFGESAAHAGSAMIGALARAYALS